MERKLPKHVVESPLLCPKGIHPSWTNIFCNSEIDILECPQCGKQIQIKCDFDDDDNYK